MTTDFFESMLSQQFFGAIPFEYYSGANCIDDSVVDEITDGSKQKTPDSEQSTASLAPEQFALKIWGTV